MTDKIDIIRSKILNDFKAKCKAYNFHPKIYVGKTQDFSEAEERHKQEGYPIFLQAATGNPKDISKLEDFINSNLINSNEWLSENKRRGSAGNTNADKLYICLATTTSSDELWEYDHLQYLGQEYPLDIDTYE